MIRHFFTRQFVKFLGVGGVAAFGNWFSRIVFSIWFPFPVAVTLSYAVGMTSAFVLNKLFVFPYANRPLAKQIRDFVATNLAFFPVVWGLAIELNKLLCSYKGIFYCEALAHAIAIAAPMLITFLIYKFIAFRTEMS